MSTVERKLTTILAADVVGFSKLMGENEAQTLETLKICRALIDGVIKDHRGRVFGSAGDSVLAEFPSPVEAVLCANEFQQLIAERNAQAAGVQPMQFRVGINIGDVIIEGDNLYGDGVNVAARLESIAQPGGVCVSSKVYDEVRRKLDVAFVDGGVQQLKNIEDPVATYHLRSGEAAEGETPASAPARGAARPGGGTVVSERPSVAVMPIKVIGGGDEVEAVAQGLAEDIMGGLAKQTAITVIGRHEGNGSGPGAAGAEADFVLEGSVRAAGQRLRLAFTLVDGAKGSQVWSERYDRQLDDVFDLQDEISRNVISTVRVRVKAQTWERLSDLDNEQLSVPDLLSKAAGFFVRSYGNNEEVEQILRMAISKSPKNSMAKAMLVACLHRKQEFLATAIGDEVRSEMIGLAEESVVLDPSSYFARLMAAVVQQDLLGNYSDALAQAETAVELNATFIQAHAMVGIARCHLGEVEEGIEVLRRAMEANKEDPHRFRHQRELAIAHFLAGREGEAATLATRLVQQAPDLRRNRPVLVALLWSAGQQDAARQHLAEVLRHDPELRLELARPVMFGDAMAGERFRNALLEAGLPP